jgi:hypothetical protein
MQSTTRLHANCTSGSRQAQAACSYAHIPAAGLPRPFKQVTGVGSPSPHRLLQTEAECRGAVQGCKLPSECRGANCHPSADTQLLPAGTKTRPLTSLPCSSSDGGFSTTTVCVLGAACCPPLLLGPQLACWLTCVTKWHTEHFTDCAPRGYISIMLQPPHCTCPYTGTCSTAHANSTHISA